MGNAAGPWIILVKVKKQESIPKNFYEDNLSNNLEHLQACQLCK